MPLAFLHLLLLSFISLLSNLKVMVSSIALNQLSFVSTRCGMGQYRRW